MQTRTYYAATVEAAMVRARRELGEEAMLVNSRKMPPESRHLGNYEVIFAGVTVTKLQSAGLLEMLQEQSFQPPAADGSELSDIRRQLVSIRGAISRGPGAHTSPEMAELQTVLESNGLESELARELVESAGKLRGAGRLYQALVTEMEGRFQVDAKPGGRIVALVGPPGRGKTTTLVKLAVKYGVAPRTPVKLISMDSYRIAAAEQMRSFASILGVAYQSLETPAALGQALAETRNGLVFIDTPGYGPRDMDAAGELADFIATRPEIDCHLVLRIDMRSADLRRAVERFSVFRPAKLIFTGLDEAETAGAVFGEAARTGIPVSFLGTGQQIPEDLEPATKQRVIGMALRGYTRAAAAAA